VKKSSETPFEETLVFVFLQFGRAFRSRMAHEYWRIGLYAGQEMFLTCLWQHEGLTQRKLAELCNVEPPTVTKVLNRMERAGLVRRSQGTPLTVSLTSRGKRLRKQVESCWLRVGNQMLTGFNTDERIILRRLMNAAKDNLERGDSEVPENQVMR
jgi:MarR family transcriptional regulator, organic hydroperoxide resistance regulator